MIPALQLREARPRGRGAPGHRGTQHAMVTAALLVTERHWETPTSIGSRRRKCTAVHSYSSTTEQRERIIATCNHTDESHKWEDRSCTAAFASSSGTGQLHCDVRSKTVVNGRKEGWRLGHRYSAVLAILPLEWVLFHGFAMCDNR